MKIPKLFKKAASFVMAAVTALSIMPATAFAAGDIGTISFSHTYDSNGNAMRYNSSANIGGYTAGGTGNYKYRMFVDGENAFCIQPGVLLKTGNTLKKASYLYQLVESKQKFISQMMTSKSPVRSAEDVDEVALSFAEVKMLATGDARFKEKMDLDIQVSKLRVLKQSYLSKHYDLEDRVLKYYPQTIKEYEERIAGYENDAALAEQHKPQGEDKFCPMTLKGMTYTEKADAGEMLLAICKDYPMSAPTEIGSYRGFRMEIYYDTVNAHYCMNLCGKAKHKVDLGADVLGNLTRIENELSKLSARLEAAKTKKAETIAQLETAKEEIKKPFAFEDELKEKAERLNALNIELNLNEKDTSVMDTEPEQTEEQPERKCASRER